MMGGRMMGGRMMGGAMAGSASRHRQAMMNGIPEPYAFLGNPLPSGKSTLAEGAAVYQHNCAVCHGPSGQGDGPAAGQLNPPPANLDWSARMPMTRSDPYLDWTISEGGQKFGTAMPAFKQTLSKAQIWAVITYIQEGLPKEKSRQVGQQ